MGPYVYEIERGGEVKIKKKMCLLSVDCGSKMLWGDIFELKKCKKIVEFYIYETKLMY